jgi:hypothetical protein
MFHPEIRLVMSKHDQEELIKIAEQARLAKQASDQAIGNYASLAARMLALWQRVRIALAKLTHLQNKTQTLFGGRYILQLCLTFLSAN